MRRVLAALLAGLSLLAAGPACTRADRGYADQLVADRGPAGELRLGYFPNVTHAPALIGVRRGLFADELGSTELTTQTFNAGTEAVNALLGGSLDITFIGSGPAINAFAKSEGQGVRLIAGVTAGGAQLVVTPGISSAADLRGKQVATPSLGNTQDIALKKWLHDQDVAVGGGADQVAVVNADNPQTFQGFRAGDLDAAWLPEPWSSRLVLDAGGKVLLDERELWPDGQFPATVAIVRTGFLAEHPRTVRAFLRGLLAAVDWANGNEAAARTTTNAAIESLLGQPLAGPVIDRAWSNITLTVDPLAGTFDQLAADAVIAGVAGDAPDLTGLVDLEPLDAVLAEAGRKAVS